MKLNKVESKSIVESITEPKERTPRKLKEFLEPLSSFKTFEFKDKTSQGWEVVKLFHDLSDDRIHVIVKRNKGDFAVGLGYSLDGGYWNQGWYDYETVEDAEKDLKAKYEVEEYHVPVKEDVEEETPVEEPKEEEQADEEVSIEACKIALDSIINALGEETAKELEDSISVVKSFFETCEDCEEKAEEESPVDESIEDNPMKDVKFPFFEFKDVVYGVIYEDGKLIAGTVTNTGIMPEVEIDYDEDFSLDRNLSDLYTKIVEEKPELLDESLSQEISKDFEDAAKRYGISVEKLNELDKKYTETGRAEKIDSEFKGWIGYSEPIWNDFVEWAGLKISDKEVCDEEDLSKDTCGENEVCVKELSDNIKLEDDTTEEGGIAFEGETLGDFLEDFGMSIKDNTLEEINDALKECGIKTLKVVKDLKEGASNFGRDGGAEWVPLYCFKTYDEAQDYIDFVIDSEIKEKGLEDEEEIEDFRYTRGEELWDKERVCILDSEEIHILEDDLEELTDKVHDRAYDLDDDSDRYWALKDIEIVVEPGYYEGASIEVKNAEYLENEEDKQFILTELEKIVKEWSLSKIKMDYQFSNGEAGYSFDESLSKKSSKKLDESVKIISDLSDYKPWSRARETWEKITDADMVEEFDFLLEDMYPDGLTMTELNDLLWFDGDWVLKELGIVEEEPEEDED